MRAREYLERELQRVTEALLKLNNKRWITTRRRRKLMAPLIADVKKYDGYLADLDQVQRQRDALDDYITRLEVGRAGKGSE